MSVEYFPFGTGYRITYIKKKKCPRPKGWRQKNYVTTYGDGESYFENYHRAQLKSILSQINPNLTPRLRKANTKDVGVQVNPKTHAAVQCSLGPRTLLARKREALRKRRQDVQTPASPVTGGVRFPRTQAVYSPVAARALTSFLEDDEEEEEEKKRAESAEKTEDEVAVEGTDAQSTEEAKEKLSPGKTDDGNDQTEMTEKNKSDSDQSGQDFKSKGRVRFQVRFWFFLASDMVYFKQFCRTCQKAFNPYRVEDITCQNCKKARCSCPGTARHVDPKRPHRQDLCGRCKGKRLSCDSTFSFKYII
uniref:3CxxC-type domain-containing protein n=1 Tax=Electrophorus electricus TaxID=8005 RepID=A0A4W4H104_ELEEL